MSEPARLPRRSPLTLTVEQNEFTGDQIQALELASGWRAEPPAAALHLLFHASITSGLDPFRQQIRLLQRWEPVALANGDTQMEHRWSVETSIHGFRILGHRAARDRGLLVQSSEPRYYDDRSRQWCEAWPYDTPPAAARYELSAIDEDDCESVVGVVHYAEFVKTNLNGDPSRGWEKMPCHMLAKCAEVDAWRRLFPQELGWLRLADGADTANEPAPAHSSPALTHRPGTRNPIDVLGEPPTPLTTHAPADASAAAPDQGPHPRAPSADTTAAQTEKGFSEAAPPETPTAKRSTRRPATSRRVNTDKDADPRTALLATAATALDGSPEDVLVWATEQLGRPVNNADDLSAADLPRLRAALPSPTPRDNNASGGPEKPAPKP